LIHFEIAKQKPRTWNLRSSGIFT